MSLCAAVFAALFLPFAASIDAQSAASGDLAGDLRDFVAIPSVSGNEQELSAKIRNGLAAFHPAVDNLDDVVITLGSGSPRRLIITPIDEPGFVVSGITDEGYLRLQRLPQTGLPPIFNELYSAQPVKVGAANGKWIDGVVAGISVHLHRAGETTPSAADIENMYVDIGASSAAEVRKVGVDILSPVAIDRRLGDLDGAAVAGASLGDKFGAAALVELLRSVDPSKVKGTLTVAFVVQEWSGARGLQRILSTVHADEMIYVGRLLPGGPVAGMEGVHRAPRREPGSGVLLGLQETNGIPPGLATDLRRLADANKIPLDTDYSAGLIQGSITPPPAFPPKWVHLGIATTWADTPAETVDSKDLIELANLLQLYAQGRVSSVPGETLGQEHSPNGVVPRDGAASNTEILSSLVPIYSASGHEDLMRDAVKNMLPKWAKTETDESGNLILHLGAADGVAKRLRILMVAHMDETGFRVKSISNDGRLEVETLGGMNLDFYEGHPMLVHTASGDRDAVMELPDGWDEANFQWPANHDQSIRVDVGARSPGEVARMGIQVGDSVTVPKRYRPLLGTRANGRSFDDRVGDTAMISAVWALGGPLKNRDVTFVWSTSEEIGLVGAAALAKRLAAEGREPDYVFGIDTFVSSDSPLESPRFAYAPLGKGFAIRAMDASNIAPHESVERVVELARANRIPVQYGVNPGSGNDGSAFVPYGSVDIPLGWPLRYSHSPAEVSDARDIDALARIIAVIARNW